MFPVVLDGAKVLFFTPEDDYGVMYDTENNEVEADSLWDSIEICMRVASDSYKREIMWIENK